MTNYADGQFLLAGGCLVVFFLLFVLPVLLVLRAERLRQAEAHRRMVTCRVVPGIPSYQPRPVRPAAAVWERRVIPGELVRSPDGVSGRRAIGRGLGDVHDDHLHAVRERHRGR